MKSKKDAYELAYISILHMKTLLLHGNVDLLLQADEKYKAIHVGTLNTAIELLEEKGVILEEKTVAQGEGGGEMSNAIKRLRTEKGITQEKLAVMAQISRSYLSTVETGAAKPTIGVAQAIARGLGERIDKVFME